MARTRDLVLELIFAYLRENERRGFTYAGLRRYYYRGVKQGRFERAEWHTIERVIRRLSEEGLLKRVWYGRNKVVFVPTEHFWREFGLTPDGWVVANGVSQY